MNYWPAESSNLAELHEPMLALVRDLSVTGAKTASVNYGARGWVAHHNSDLWRQSAPVSNYGEGDPVWAMWPMARRGSHSISGSITPSAATRPT